MYKILLVDDEDLEREALRIIISNRIDEVEIVGEASFGEEAIEMSERFDPDMILMDIKMPGMDGLKATEIIKSKDENKVVIIISAYDDFRFAQKAVRVRADDYLLKPVRPDDIIGLLKKYKNKKYSINNSIQELLTNIYECNYKKSKDILKEIIEYFREIYTIDNLEYIKKLGKDTANKMINVLKQMGLNYMDICKKSNYNQRLSYAINIYGVAECLQDILGEVFDEIIKSKTSYKNNELNCALNYIEKNLKDNITLQDVSKYVNLSNSYLSRLFKKELNINFVKYIALRRIEESKYMLKNTNISINDIAFDMGYNEPNYFCRVFKKIEGLTPTQYRVNSK